MILGNQIFIVIFQDNNIDASLKRIGLTKGLVECGRC